MALFEMKFQPGVDKQDTAVGAADRWVDSDNVRWRYNLPEKVGGWSSLLTDTICGVARKQHSFVDTDGNRYVAIGTDKFLLIYFEGALHDVTPWRSNNAGAQITFTGSTLTTNSTAPGTSITITTTSGHGLEVGDMIVLDSVTMPTSSTLSAALFEDKICQVISIPSSVTFTITSPSAEAGGGGADLTAGSSSIVQPYQRVGPSEQTYGYGYGVGNFGGTITGSLTNSLNGLLAADTAGTGGVGTSVTLTSATGFPDPIGTIAVGVLPTAELITYTGVSTNDLTTITRGALGTATPGTSNGQSHATTTIVYNASDWTGYGNAVSASTVTLEPGLWSLSNWGEVLVATIANGKTFTWNSGIAGSAKFTTQASTLTTNYVTALSGTVGNPTASRLTLVSPTTRHLLHFGTETTIGDTTTQDDMFIRFSNQEQINTFAPAADNSAGTQRLQDGTKIIGAIKGKENILVWTDNALYSMKFVGSPFTFGFEQVGTNCGLLGQNACCEIDGVAYWVGNNGFFSFDGTVNSLACSVEDYVYDSFDTTKGQQVTAGINNLFTEVIWYYPAEGSNYNDRYVVFNYGEKSQLPTGVWYTGTNTNSIRTTWIDSIVYPKPYATQFNSSSTGTFPSIVGETGLGQTVYFQHEIGNDQINPNGTITTLTSSLQSYDFAVQTDKGLGEYFLAMRRFLPDFKTLTGKAKVTLGVKNYPSDSTADSTYSPFEVLPTSQKFDTRARGRYASVKIENENAGETWRYGTFQVDVQADGRR
jgi:hypothetical protein